VINSIDYSVPEYDSLHTVASSYYSHVETVINPDKQFLESMLESRKRELDWSLQAYNSAVSSFNIYPTEYGLSTVNSAKNQYLMNLDRYNSLVDRYNVTPSYNDRPVYLPYSFREGNVNYGWGVRISYTIGGITGDASGRDIDAAFVRIGTKYTDRSPANRRDQDIQFNVSVEGSLRHLFAVVNSVCDQMTTAIGNAITAKVHIWTE